MTRINVCDEWRMLNTNTTFKMELSQKVDMQKVFETMKSAVEEIRNDEGFADLWLQDLNDSCTKESFEVESTLNCDEYVAFIPVMIKAIAKSFPTISFNGYACRDDMKCYWIDEHEFSYDGHTLRIKETFMDDDNGYFCPDCGYLVAYPYEEFDSDEIECDDCEEMIKVADLKYVPPVVTEETITIR